MQDIVWDEFFNRIYVAEELEELIYNYPYKKYISIDMKLLELYDLDLVDELINNPIEYIEQANAVLNSVVGDRVLFEEFKNDCYIRIENIPDSKKILLKEIREKELFKMVSLSGTIRRVGPLVIRFRSAAFECQRCGYITNMFQIGNKFTQPMECESEQCGRQGPFKLLVGESGRQFLSRNILIQLMVGSSQE